MGSDTTPLGIKTQFIRSYKVLAARQDALCAAGKDPKDASLDHLGAHKQPGEFSHLSGNSRFVLRKIIWPKTHFSYVWTELMLFPEVAKFMGSDVTPVAVKIQYNTKVRALSRRQAAMVGEGKDPKDALDSSKGCRKSCRYSAFSCHAFFSLQHLTRFHYSGVTLIKIPLETARIMGSDTTPSSLNHHFHRTVKVLGRRQLSILAAGGDSKDVSLDKLGSGESKGGQKFCHLSYTSYQTFHPNKAQYPLNLIMNSPDTIKTRDCCNYGIRCYHWSH